MCSFSKTISFLVLPDTITKTSNDQCDVSQIMFHNEITLADPTFQINLK